MKNKIKIIKPTKKEMIEYDKHLIKEAKKFKLNSKDLSNLYDLFYLVDYKDIKLNRLDKWYKKFFVKIERIVIPELHNRLFYKKYKRKMRKR